MKITESNFSAKFVCEAKNIVAALTKLNTLNKSFKVTESESTYLFVCYDRILYVLCYTPETLCYIICDSQFGTEENTTFAFDCSTLLGVIKKRKTLEIEYDKSSLHLKEKQTRFKTSLKTKPVYTSQVELLTRRLGKEKENIKISPETISKMREGVKLCTLKDIYKTGNDPLLYISMQEGLTISSFDNFHCSYYKANTETANIRFPLKSQIFNVIDSLASGTCRYEVSESYFKITGDDFLLVLPPTQVETFDYSKVSSYLKGLSNPVGKMYLPNSIDNTLNNFDAISESDSQIQLRIKEKELEMAMVTAKGSIEDAFSVPKMKFESYPFDMNIDPKVFNDLFNKVRGVDTFMQVYSVKSGALSCFVLKVKCDFTLNLIGSYHAS